MSKKKDLKSYLLHWKENFSAEVTGQSAVGPHLEEDVLLAMARSIAGINNASAENVNHLSFCPECLERWAELFKDETDDGASQSTEMSSMSYGTMEEDDVCGQSSETQLRSQCGRFVLDITSTTITVSTIELEFDGRTVQLRDRTGQIILEGQFVENRLTGEIADHHNLDLSVWTVILRALE